jgi:hypothetical protein
MKPPNPRTMKAPRRGRAKKTTRKKKETQQKKRMKAKLAFVLPVVSKSTRDLLYA